MKNATCNDRLKQLFDRQHETDVMIADKLGVSKQSICMWKSGYRSPKRSMLEHIAQVYNVDVAWLLGYDEDPTETREPTPLERQLAERISALSPAELERVLAYIDGMEAARKV